ncbi:recombinase RecT [Lacticaseibacillus zhaodongensis]|uniref:recombinase RecT n=1 Tax=Lacticaseibacillus zhaodongensis TaxID=2668065 RepID=UPI001E47CEC4|nr:RecT family recombinase [Lacticaseibacillus zhaodongensis]
MANELINTVISRIGAMQKEQGLTLPADYSVANALNAAWLMLTDDTRGQSLQSRTSPTSQSQALLNMAIQGLSPAKNQGYFIAYGQQLSFQRSYFGSITVLKRLPEIKDVWAEVVHQGDEFSIGGDQGHMVIKTFNPSFENQDKPIVGAFAVIVKEDGSKDYTVMTKKEIDVSWSHAKTKKVQNEFPQEMAQRTVLNRAAKMYINTSVDNDMLVKAVSDTTHDEYDDDAPRKDVTDSATAKQSSVDKLINTATKRVKQQKQAAPAKEVTPDDGSTDSNTDEADAAASQGSLFDTEPAAPAGEDAGTGDEEEAMETDQG